MQSNLVIVESPHKAETIEKFLGSDYKVMSSYGHIRDLKKKSCGIDAETFEPLYEIPSDKQKVVRDLREAAVKAKMVWLASDEDREGEAISWHLFKVLGLRPDITKRIVFHEITKDAILNAIKNPRDIDNNLVDAQQARRVLDRIVGFKLSPILWKKIKPSLSAGRVQSAVVRLIVEREREIKDFESTPSYRVVAQFRIPGSDTVFKAEMKNRLTSKEQALAFLEQCKNAEFKVSGVQTKPFTKCPPAPFTTSTLQQEAARKYGYSVMQTMLLAQHLYESGYITYMRTDSVVLSQLCLGACKTEITSTLGSEYVKLRKFTQKSKGAQEAHEAIRPTFMSNRTIPGNTPEQHLYDLIWKRTLASQMAEAELEKTTITISSKSFQEEFVATGEVVSFDGFLKIYKESVSDDSQDESTNSVMLPKLKKGSVLEFSQIDATQRFAQHPPRYNEAALVHKLEELGIGRPSTYAPIINTVQQREYVVRENVAGVEHKINQLLLDSDGTLQDNMLKEVIGSEKAKLIPTDTGIVVNNFLEQYFYQIIDYNFTAKVEKDFDDIARGSKKWKKVIESFYADFEPRVEQISALKNEHKIGEHLLGTDPVSGKTVSAKIGRFGPIVQIGSAEDEEKPRFAQMKKGQSIESITLEEALELFKLPRTLGEYQDSEIIVNDGRFGPYIRFESKFISVPKDMDPMSITLEQAVSLIEAKREVDKNNLIKSFELDGHTLQILNGRFGPYISYNGSNYKIPKDQDPAALTEEQCQSIVSQTPATKQKKYSRSKK